MINICFCSLILKYKKQTSYKAARCNATYSDALKLTENSQFTDFNNQH